MSVRVSSPSGVRRHLAGEASVRMFAVLWGGLALVVAGRHLGAPAGLQVLALAALVGGACLGQRAEVAACAAGIGWLVVTGFVVHRYGDLAWSGRGDLTRLALLGAAAVLGVLARPERAPEAAGGGR